jgi:hypothetical protein
VDDRVDADAVWVAGVGTVAVRDAHEERAAAGGFAFVLEIGHRAFVAALRARRVATEPVYQFVEVLRITLKLLVGTHLGREEGGSFPVQSPPCAADVRWLTVNVASVA